MDDREGIEGTKRSRNGRQKELYETVKQLTGQCHKKPAAVKSKDGKLLKRKEERLNMWKEHFQELLNREQPLEPPQNEENESEKKLFRL